MNGTAADRPCAGKQVIKGCLELGGRAHHWTVDFGIPRYAAVSRSVKMARATRGSSAPMPALCCAVCLIGSSFVTDRMPASDRSGAYGRESTVFLRLSEMRGYRLAGALA